MKAWVEWHFADFARLSAKGRSFDCSTCREDVKKLRRCHEDKWDHPASGNTVFPIRLIEGTPGHSFCPAKLFRDDPGTAEYAQMLFLSWELGQVPDGGTVGTMDREEAILMGTLIVHWKEMSRFQDFTRLGRMFSGPEE